MLCYSFSSEPRLTHRTRASPPPDPHGREAPAIQDNQKPVNEHHDKPPSRTPFLPASRTQGAERTAVIGPLTLCLVLARSTASGIRSPRHLCRQSPPPRPCSPSPHCSHYILITSEDYPRRPRHAQRISSSNLRGDVSDIRASITTRRRQRSLRYRRLCRRPLYKGTKTRKTKRHFIHE